MAEKKYKCPYCEARKTRSELSTHIEEKHFDMIPQGYSPYRVAFNDINKKTHGTCVICKKETKWNEAAGKYNRLCERRGKNAGSNCFANSFFGNCTRRSTSFFYEKRYKS